MSGRDKPVLGAEIVPEQPLLGVHARDQDDRRTSAVRASPTIERKTRLQPTDVDEQPEIGRVADHAVKPVGDERVVRLDRDEAAEPAPEDEHRREAQDAAGGA